MREERILVCPECSDGGGVAAMLRRVLANREDVHS
jgi:hypothetical protein